MAVAEKDSYPFFSLNQRELFRRVGWLVHLRWAAIGCVLASVLAIWLLRGPMEGMGVVLALSGIAISYNLVFAVINHRVRTAPARWKNIVFAWMQIVADLGALTAVVHFTGGINSVFVFFYMVHLGIAAGLLRRAHTFATVVLASLLLDLVVYLEHAGVLVGRQVPGFTIGVEGSVERADSLVALCLVMNSAFFLTSFVASSISARLRESEREIERVNSQLSALNTQKSAFMRMTGHEMRSPLNAMLGLLHLLEKRQNGENVPVDNVELIARCRKRLYAMSDLIGDLLEYSRLQAADSADRKGSLDLADLTAQAIEELAPMAEVKEIPLSAKTERCLVEGDENQLLVLTKNLLSNALRYTAPPGGVEVSLCSKDGWAILRVKDDGIGIAAESVAHIFQEFFRAPEARDYEPTGTGLGLTLCKAIVERHGGEIQVESEQGRGSVFTVRLPIRGN